MLEVRGLHKTFNAGTPNEVFERTLTILHPATRAPV